MTERIRLNICFKGERTYLHGTDIYNEVTKHLSDDMRKGDFELSFHELIHTDVELSDTKPQDKAALKFVCKYVSRDNRRQMLFGVTTDTPVNCRVEYCEDKIRSRATLRPDIKEIVLATPSPYSFIENATALNKYLLEELFPAVAGKWYLTRIQIKRMPGDIYPLRLVLKENFNFMLLKTEMTINGELIGFLYFSLVRGEECSE